MAWAILIAEPFGNQRVDSTRPLTFTFSYAEDGAPTTPVTMTFMYREAISSGVWGGETTITFPSGQTTLTLPANTLSADKIYQVRVRPQQDGIAGGTERLFSTEYFALSQTISSSPFSIPDLPPGTYKAVVKTQALPGLYSYSSNEVTFTRTQGIWTREGEVTSSTQSGQITGLDTGDYEVQVRTADAEGFGPWSSAASFTVLPPSNVYVRSGGTWKLAKNNIKSLGTWIETKGTNVKEGGKFVPLERVRLPPIGSPFYGGYFAGIIDTKRGNIIAADQSQVGQRYALVLAPKSMEVSLRYKSTNTAAPSASRTRWDGLSATEAMNSSEYPAALYCQGLDYPSDIGSPWYLGAMDEMQLVYQNLKPTDLSYLEIFNSPTFPGGQVHGYQNISSDPLPSADELSLPQTSSIIFQGGQPQEMGAVGSTRIYWSSTEDSDTTAWMQTYSGPFPGWRISIIKSSNSWVRPVRRIPL